MNSSNVLNNLINDNIELFSLPDIVIKLNDLVNDPDSNTQQFTDLILQDAPLTLRLLKLVNSSYYNFSTPIDTISQAVNVLGISELSNFVIATKMIKKFNQCPMSLVSINDFWRHNLACATAAQTIAAELKITSSEHFYISGLIHDIGKLVLYVTQPTLCESIIKKMNSDIIYVEELETKIFGFDHNEVGALLIKMWGLPEVFIATTKYHHHPVLAEKFKTEIAVNHLANAIANLIEKPLSFDDALPIHSSIWKTLEVDSSKLIQLTQKSEIKYKSVSSIIIDKKVA